MDDSRQQLNISGQQVEPPTRHEKLIQLNEEILKKLQKEVLIKM
jgi:hypothetical protein